MIFDKELTLHESTRDDYDMEKWPKSERCFFSNRLEVKPKYAFLRKR